MVEFPIEQVQQRGSQAQKLGDEIHQSLEEIEFEMAQAFGDVPADMFSADALLLVRFALLSCFTDPLCETGDQRPLCIRRMHSYDPRAVIAVQLDERPPMYSHQACELPVSDNFLQAASTWSDESVDWFRRRVVLVDSLRVRLKAMIPTRLDELDARLANYDADLKQLSHDAEDIWREAQRTEKRLEQRRRDEEQWERFRTEMQMLEERLMHIRSDVDRLREHQRRDVRAVAVRIATLGTSVF